MSCHISLTRISDTYSPNESRITWMSYERKELQIELKRIQEELAGSRLLLTKGWVEKAAGSFPHAASTTYSSNELDCYRQAG